jgi:hypothetical protein
VHGQTCDPDGFAPLTWLGWPGHLGTFIEVIKMGSAVLMMHSQEIVLEAKESIKKQIQNKFKSNMLPMHKNLVNKQVHEKQSNKHRKIKQV